MAHSNLTIVFACIGLLFFLERVFPLRNRVKRTRDRLWVNGVLSLLTYATAAAIVRPSLTWAMSQGEQAQVGILDLLRLPPIFEAVAAFLLLDLSFYYWHRLNHTSRFLWRFHNVHHYDPDLDVSTGFRFHFGEVFLSTLFRVAQGGLIGASIEAFAVFELVFQIATYFHHSNLRLPKALDPLLNTVVVTPRMHAIHHSQNRKETDSNFSVILSLWDRIHGTFIGNIDQNKITIGVPGYSSDEDHRVTSALLAPFRTQHRYWP